MTAPNRAGTDHDARAVFVDVGGSRVRVVRSGALGERRPVHLAGNSLGGAVALQVLALAPQRVATAQRPAEPFPPALTAEPGPCPEAGATPRARMRHMPSSWECGARLIGDRHRHHRRSTTTEHADGAGTMRQTEQVSDVQHEQAPEHHRDHDRIRAAPRSAVTEALCDPARVHALLDSGLSATSDPEMDAIAAQVRRWIGVPVALVSLVQPDQQVFPGMVGMPEPWATRRSTPLTHSFCQHVVVSGEPLVITDAREVPLVRDNLAIPDLGVIAYAGMPLTDEQGNVLGSLCAIDTRPRSWTPDELELLADLAAHCSTALRLRLIRRDLTLEGRRRDAVETAMRGSLNRSQTLLLAAQVFTGTTTVADVHDQLAELVTRALAPSYVGVFLLGPTGTTVQRLAHHDDRATRPAAVAALARWAEFPVTERVPSATAIRENRPLHYPDRDAYDAEHPAPARDLLRAMDLQSCIAAPLPGPDGVIGSIVLGWEHPGPAEPAHLQITTVIAGYAAQALSRAQRLAHRINVAHELQQAMLPTLPTVDGLDLAARYLPADSREHVGGDWFDAIALHDPARPDRQNVLITVGDIVGHTLAAATVMSQARPMLRQAACVHPAGPPSRILTVFEDANHTVELDAAGTAVLAHLFRDAPEDGGTWTMRWTNAGHPPPVLIGPDGHVEVLDEHGMMFGYRHLRFTDDHRDDHERGIAPGSLLVLYTDGLVEKRRSDIDAGIATLVELLREIHTHSPRDVATTLTTTLAPHADDDIVVLAIRF